MSYDEMNARMREIPAVQTVMRGLDQEAVKMGPWLTQAVREVLDEVRGVVQTGHAVPSLTEIQDRARARAHDLSRPRLRSVINATGVMIHTNLGRSPLPASMMDHLASVATQYSTLEYRLAEGVRGSRHEHVEGLLAELSGAQAAMVVNNNAAAVMLALSTMANGREVVVSRGELVEIGGSFRVPEVMTLSGARLTEVGATNKTHLYDYERAITDNTALMLKVHQSNFRQLGFVESVSRSDLVALGRVHNIPVLEDLGSGVLLPLAFEGYEEPTVPQVVADGVAVTTFSGDKLLGGPQAGLIVGQSDWVSQMKKNPLARAVRVDKMTLVVLELVLRWYKEGRGRELPLWRMIYMPLDSIFQRAQTLAVALRARVPGLSMEIERDWSEIGGGSMPGTRISTWVVAIGMEAHTLGAVERALRLASNPVVARLSRGRLLLDLRTVFEHQESQLLNTLTDVLRETR